MTTLAAAAASLAANRAAVGLYEQLGFEVTSYNMSLRLQGASCR
jgi:hypothetical protein